VSRRSPAARPGLEILEEALLLLRREPALLAAYFVGSLPFVLGFLTFWGDMSRSGAAAQHCAPFALALALLLAWMKLWHAVFAQGVLTVRVGRPAQSLSLRRALSILAVQTPLQATGIALLPAAAILVLPFGWVYAFYQHAAVAGAEGRGLRATTASAWHQAARAPGQNHLLLLLLAALGHFALVNVAAGLVLLPFLLKALLGVESPFTRNPWVFTSTTFLAAVVGLTYLCVDPLVKAAYALRHFYGEAEASGADLWADLRATTEGETAAGEGEGRRLRGRALAALSLVSCLCLAALPARAREEPREAAAVAEPSPLAPAELDRAISQVLSRSEYAWRLPPPPEDETEEPGLLARFWAEVGELLAPIRDAVSDALRALLRWIAGLLPGWKGPGTAPPAWDAGWIRVLLLASLAAVGAILLLLLARRRRAQAVIPTPAEAHALDLEDDRVSADALPPEDWESLARDLLRQGEARLALRALYLGSLARLARERLLTVARHKSNRDYAEELARRTDEASGLRVAFAENVRLFERVWYGDHAVTEEILGRFQENQGRLLAHGR